MCIIRRTDRSIMTDYSSADDNSLLSLSSKGDREAEEELIRRYTKLVRLSARRFFLLGGEQEDLIQEGTLGLLNAIRSYRAEAGASFKTFAQKCILYRIMDISSSSGYKGFLSCEDLTIPETEEINSDPEIRFIENERYEELLAKLKSQLSDMESTVLDEYLKGSSYSEIASVLGKTNQSVYNAVQRIRAKLSALI